MAANSACLRVCSSSHSSSRSSSSGIRKSGGAEGPERRRSWLLSYLVAPILASR